jgi:acetyl-CoA carboxylase carboxyl transferase subunit beta
MTDTNDPGKRRPPAGRRTGWLSRFAPGVRSDAKRDAPENLWVKDADTGELLYRPDLEAALWVTPSGRHMRIGPEQRFRVTFDDGRWEEITPPEGIEDPLRFSDGKPYRERLDAARRTSGRSDAMAIGAGAIRGVAAGEAFIAACRAAVDRDAPLVAFTASGGARMQEGTLSLMQLARTTLAIQELKAARLPYIVVLTDPTTGGVTASYAMLGDVHLAEPGALIGFAGPRVIEQTIREKLPAGFQRSEFLQDKGMVDRVTTRAEMPAVLGSILGVLMAGRARVPAGTAA